MKLKPRATESHLRIDPRLLAALLPVAAAFWLCSCAGGEAQFQVAGASDPGTAPLVVSLLGAYDGSINEEAGANFARDLSRLLGHEPCVPGLNGHLRTTNPELHSALETQAESSGLDDEVLRMLSPAAEGEFILALEMSGRLTKSEEEASPPRRSSTPTAPAPNGRAASRGGGMGRHSPRGAPRNTQQSVAQSVEVQAPADLQVSAFFFSVRQQRTVSSIVMRYTGSDLEDGLRKLAERLTSTYPNTVCRAWEWGHVRVVHEQDSAGLPLSRFHLERTN